MNVREFLWELSTYLPLKVNVEKTMDKYTDLIVAYIDKSHKSYDLKKALDHILLNSTFKTFPTIKDIIEALEHAIIPKPVEHSKYLGYQIRVFFNSGRYTDFTICSFGPTFNEIKERCKISDKVKKAVMYPPSVTLVDEETGKQTTVDVALIGENVYPADTPAKVIYISA